MDKLGPAYFYTLGMLVVLFFLNIYWFTLVVISLRRLLIRGKKKGIYEYHNKHDFNDTLQEKNSREYEYIKNK